MSAPLPTIEDEVEIQGIRVTVRTEDGGKENPRITTSVLQRGCVIARREIDYREILGSEVPLEAVSEMMAEQHRALLEEARRGKFPFRRRTLDELVAESLAAKQRRQAAVP